MMNYLARLVLILTLMGISKAIAQDTPAPSPNSSDCKPCWIEPWLCKKPPCPQNPVKSPDANTQPQSPERPKLQHMQLTGIVKSFGIVQEEPAQTPQASFTLQVKGPDGQVEGILISMPEYEFHCSEGDQATLDGDFAPADAMWPAALLSPHLISCHVKEGSR